MVALPGADLSLDAWCGTVTDRSDERRVAALISLAKGRRRRSLLVKPARNTSRLTPGARTSRPDDVGPARPPAVPANLCQAPVASTSHPDGDIVVARGLVTETAGG